MELKKQQTWSLISTHMYHYRTRRGEEIDLILESFTGDLLAIEIKASSTFDNRSIHHIQELQKAMPHKTIIGLVLYMGNKALQVAPDIYIYISSPFLPYGTLIKPIAKIAFLREGVVIFPYLLANFIGSYLLIKACNNEL
mgnify:CR=1 FL=1